MAIARTPEEEQAVRDNLVSICAKVFLRDGYSKVTMKSLSDEAGCTTGKFYSNFAGKPEILSILVEKLTRVNYEEGRKLMEEDDPSMMQIIYFFVLEFEICHVNDKIRELFYYAYEDSDALRTVAEYLAGPLKAALTDNYGKKLTDTQLTWISAMNVHILRASIMADQQGYAEEEIPQMMLMIGMILDSCGITGKDAEEIKKRLTKSQPKFRDATYNLIIHILQSRLA